MSLRKAVEQVNNSGTLLEKILRRLDKDDGDYLIYLLAETNTPCPVISKALKIEGHTISDRTLQKERVKLVSKRNS
jgi:hypothetical protein